MFKNILIVLVFTSYLVASGQSTDTLLLHGAEITAPRGMLYETGSNITILDSGLVARSCNLSLGTLLSDYTSLYIKSFGPGGSSIVCSRGGESRHTAVLWQGFNINSSTLGMADLSLIPVSFCDRIAIVKGGTSAINGNSALGGVLLLDSENPSFNGKESFKIATDAGSFGTNNISGIFKSGSDKIESITSVNYGTTKNNFKYVNLAKRGFPNERMSHASSDRFGLVQDFRFKTGPNQFATVTAWYQTVFREIPPLMTDPQGTATQSDSSFRIVTGYHFEKGKHFLLAKAMAGGAAVSEATPWRASAEGPGYLVRPIFCST